MARETMDKIRQAEELADRKVQDARNEARQILKAASKEAEARIEQAKEAAAQALEAARAEAETIAQQESEKTLQEGTEEIQRLKAAVETKKGEGIDAVISEIL